MSTIEQEPMIQEPPQQIIEVRDHVAQILSGQLKGLVAISGPCPMDGRDFDDRGQDIGRIRAKEIEAQQALQASSPGLVGVMRMPPYKPRTKPESWHGHETDNADSAMSIIEKLANNGANPSIEIVLPEHIHRYGHNLAIGWIGARSFENSDLQEKVAIKLPEMSLGIKNSLDGHIEPALDRIEKLQALRPDGAPVVLVYRGGENAKTAEQWEKQYRRAMELTNGLMIVDTAHGGEMAHDLKGRFAKSVIGQIACFDHIIRLADEEGLIPAGTLVEASDVVSRVDPHIPFREAMRRQELLNQIRLGQGK